MVQISQKLVMQLKQSPQQVLLSSLLQLPVLSLEQRIRMELETNPLLEMELDDEAEQELEENAEQTLEETEAEEEEEPVDKTKEEIDWEEILNDQESFDVRIPKEKNADTYEKPEVYQESLTDHLISQLHFTELPPDEVVIGEYIIWNINSVGYLGMTVEDLAVNLQEDPETIERVLGIIQRFDPVGIGARNLQECLLVQLLEERPHHEEAIRIIRDHFNDFKNKRYEKLAKDLGLELEQIKGIIGHITKLNPKPGEGYASIVDNYIIPDLEVRKDDGEFKIFMHDWNVPQLRINNEYRKMMLDRKHTSKETRDYIKNRLESARWLINSIHQRRATILRVMETIIDKQRDFFNGGPEHLKPLILKDIADEIGMDISTVSRVTNGKYVQTEWGLFELKYFFSEKIRSDEGEDVSNKIIKGLIKDIISAEPPKKPYNDQKIAEMLKNKGFNVARRTVAKYREQMMIPVSRLRRKI
ncbi:RNA polymerase factor sigma-54 [candidate division KSB1 bacterium]|nr:RNA polymerase factor sigma-54 [candidate division KSB1 bacterium]